VDTKGGKARKGDELKWRRRVQRGVDLIWLRMVMI